MRKRTLLHKPFIRYGLLGLLLVASLTGCSRASQQTDQAPDVSIKLELDPDPPLFGRACRMTLTILDADGAPIDGATLSIKGDMTHAGMVPVLAETHSSQGGVYTGDFEWSMSGDWVLTVLAQLPDGRTAQRTFEIAVGIPGG